jgi:Rod binding domain-containing protein
VSLPLESGAGVQAGGGVPIVDQALEPEWVRHGSAATQKAYTSALAFEQTLVEQLSQSLAASSGMDGEGSSEGEGSEEGSGASGQAGDSQLSAMLPQALAGGVMHAGGLGLAAQLTRQLEAQSTGGHTPLGGVSPGGGTVAPAGGAAASSGSASGGAAA